MSMIRRAFTLEEVLTAMGIILILSSILYSVVASAKESGKTTAP